MKKHLFFIALFFVSVGLSAQSWTQQNTNFGGSSIYAKQICIVDQNIVWIKGANGVGGSQIRAFSRTNNGGTTWSATIANGFTSTVYPKFFAAASYNNAFAVASDTVSHQASFWKTTDGGATWSTVSGVLNNSPTTFADGVYFWDGSKGFCYGDPVSNEFEIYTTSDGGTTWTPVAGANISDPSAADEYGMNVMYCGTVVPGTGVAYFATNKGRIFKTTDYGANWAVTTAAPFTTVTDYIYVIASSANYIIAGNMDGGSGVYDWKYSSDGGGTWQAFVPSGSFYDTQLCYVPGTSNTFVSVGAVDPLGVSHSPDGGANWTDYTDLLLQFSGNNIQATSCAFYSATLGWVGNFDHDGVVNSILKYDGIVGIDNSYQMVNGNDLNIYPNPGTGNVFFAVNGPNKEDINITVYDVTGKMIFQQVLNVGGTSVTSYDFSELSKGLYIVNVKSVNENYNKKLVIN
jgi:hypothetical protein